MNTGIVAWHDKRGVKQITEKVESGNEIACRARAGSIRQRGGASSKMPRTKGAIRRAEGGDVGDSKPHFLSPVSDS